MKKLIIFSLLLLVTIGIVALFLYHPKANIGLVKDEKEYLFYISSDNCASCKSIAEDIIKYQEYANKNEDVISFYKVDIAYVNLTEAELIKKYGTDTTPTLFYIKNGRIYEKVVGVDKVLELLNKQYGNTID